MARKKENSGGGSNNRRHKNKDKVKSCARRAPRRRRDDEDLVPRRPPLVPRHPTKIFLDMEALQKKLFATRTSPMAVIGLEDIAPVIAQWTNHQDWTVEEAKLAASIVSWLQQKLLEASDSPSYNQQLKDVCLQVLSRNVYVNLINAFAKASPNQCRASENILDYMDDISKEYPQFKPDRVAINTVIGAWAKNNEPGSADRAKQLLQRLEKDFLESGKSPLLKPNAKSYGKVIDAYAREGRPDCAGRVLRHVEDTFRFSKKTKNDFGIAPTVQMYTAVIDGYAREAGRSIKENKKVLNERAIDCAEEVLQGLLSFYSENNLPETKPDAVLVSAIINAWSKSNRRERLDRVTDIFSNMINQYGIDLDITAYNTYLNVLASVGDRKSVQKAEDVLSFLEDNKSLKPDHYSYNTVLKAYANNSNMGVEAENLLQRWECRYKSGSAVSMPDCHSYSSVINCWASSNAKDAATKAEEILDWMERNNVAPNLYCYNGALKACSRIGDAERARVIWERMPGHDNFSYVNMIGCLSRASGNFEQACEAESLLKRAHAQKRLRPDHRVCTVVLTALGRSAHEEAGERAESLLDWMHSIGLPPDAITYNAALGAYQHYQHADNEERAMSFFKQMKTEPTTVTYGVMVDVCQNRQDYIAELFENCIQRGLMDDRLIDTFREHGPPSVVSELKDKDGIPAEWRRFADRGPGGLSKKTHENVKSKAKAGSGRHVKEWGW